ncbi:BTAD domain-containing putative transcriptional regulator [Raineyella sp. LH-20]|uniref:AfsR/SARP family transcriptional regulator n=1 Tax=Raineyella sp. LH-20 TaxID=3081204 RepID=UPI0029539282|nr:BTAD domain-containing putative transcriptional regulator [Raineyella sp. LH-20]WOP18901.1 BTAD domain-containing putative transcriptional regulator [Raineyella sp. LH-20]
MSIGLIQGLAARRGPGPVVHLLGQPRVCHAGREAPVSDGAARLLAYLAVHSGTHERRQVAAALWPDADTARAAGNLRTAVWRLGGLGPGMVEASPGGLRLAPGALVDVDLLHEWAVRVVSGEATPDDLACLPWDVEGLDLLPRWQDDWILVERERLRQRLLHALEVLGRLLIARGHCAEAVDIALVATAADELRESAQRVLIEAYLAEENRSEAARRFAAYRALLHRELGIEPSPELFSLVDGRARAR